MRDWSDAERYNGWLSSGEIGPVGRKGMGSKRADAVLLIEVGD